MTLSTQIKKSAHRIWFRLTTRVECAWCKKRIRRALIPLPSVRVTDSIRLPRISHTICPTCAERLVTK